jgi:hypothetical protein
MLPAAASIAATPPTVDGLFYGPGDPEDPTSYDEGYIPLGENEGRGTIYYILDGSRLQLAVVVDTSVNDNVFGDTNDPVDSDYLKDAGWSGGGANHTAAALIGSDNVELLLKCGTYEAQWKQDYIYETATGEWASGPDGPDGTPIPIELSPPSSPATFASSLEWNFENTTWPYTNTQPSNPDNWTSVNTNTLTLIEDEEGWNPHDGDPILLIPPSGDGFNDLYGWEWAMVYEMNFDVSVCSGEPIQIDVISAHNSPSKDGDEDVPIPAYDFGDAPDSYGTSLAMGGPHHELLLGAPYLGSIVDPEGDAVPDGSAATDDFLDSLDDEDGIKFLTQPTPGIVASILVTAPLGGILDAWIDFGNCDGGAVGTFDAVDKLVFVNSDGSALVEGDPGYDGILDPADGPVYTLYFMVPDCAWTDLYGETYARFRISSDGTPLPTGYAPDGEVEDYRLEIPTAVKMASFTATGQAGSVLLEWETVSEVNNLGFYLHRADAAEGARTRLNGALIPSASPGSQAGAVYNLLDTQVMPGITYYYWLEDVDTSGMSTMHGPVIGTALFPEAPLYRVFLPAISH